MFKNCSRINTNPLIDFLFVGFAKSASLWSDTFETDSPK